MLELGVRNACIDHRNAAGSRPNLRHGVKGDAIVGSIGKTWVKLSGAYQDSKVGAPSYSDTIPVARAYIKAAPQRVVWASDWPHPTEKEKPDDAVLFDLLAEWAPDPASRMLILVQNPATLYGFST